MRSDEGGVLALAARRARSASLLCAFRAIGLLVIAVIGALSIADLASSGRPSALVATLVGIAVRILGAIGFAVAAKLLRRRRRDAALVAIVFAGLDLLGQIGSIDFVPVSATTVLPLLWIAVDGTLIVLLSMAWGYLDRWVDPSDPNAAT
jgi:hypothetical protein